MLTPEQRNIYMTAIRRFPVELDKLLDGLTEAQLTTPYLEGEWTVAQNVHHVADSHMNSYVRLKLILSEERPPLKGYDQDVWATYPDATTADLEATSFLLKGLHARWVSVFERLSDAQWSRVGIHSEIGEVSVDDLVKTYAEHCEAHLDQITRTLAAQP